ncbi:unnamed protein product, partial [marine sediment metagenome]
GREVTPEEIKSAYRREALRWHPDRNSGDRGAEQRFKAAAAAYEVLRDPEKRWAYDVELAGFGRESVFADVQGNSGRGRGRGRGCGRGRGGRCARGFGRGRQWWARADRGSAGGPLVDISLGPIEAVVGCRRRIMVESVSGTQVLDIRLPPGLADGDILHLDDLRGDLHLRVKIASAV